MVFDTLSIGVQNLYVENFNFLYKSLLIFIAILISLLIIKYWNPKKLNKSKFLAVNRVKKTYYVLSWIIITTIPLQLGYLSPKVTLSTVLLPCIIVYGLNFVLLGGIISLNFLWYGSAFITDFFDGGNRADPIKREFMSFVSENK